MQIEVYFGIINNFLNKICKCHRIIKLDFEQKSITFSFLEIKSWKNIYYIQEMLEFKRIELYKCNFIDNLPYSFKENNTLYIKSLDLKSSELKNILVRCKKTDNLIKFTID